MTRPTRASILAKSSHWMGAASGSFTAVVDPASSLCTRLVAQPVQQRIRLAPKRCHPVIVHDDVLGNSTPLTLGCLRVHPRPRVVLAHAARDQPLETNLVGCLNGH